MLEYWNIGNSETGCRRRPLHSAVDRLATVSPSRTIIPPFQYPIIPVISLNPVT